MTESESPTVNWKDPSNDQLVQIDDQPQQNEIENSQTEETMAVPDNLMQLQGARPDAPEVDPKL